MMMKNPPHPGGLLRRQEIEPRGLPVTRAAEWLGIGRVALSKLLNGRAAISPDMALRLEAAGLGSAEMWLRMQVSHDLWNAKQKTGDRLRKVSRFPEAVPA